MAVLSELYSTITNDRLLLPPSMDEMSGEVECRWKWVLVRVLLRTVKTELRVVPCTDLHRVPDSESTSALVSHIWPSSARTRCCSFCHLSRKPERITGVWDHTVCTFTLGLFSLTSSTGLWWSCHISYTYAIISMWLLMSKCCLWLLSDIEDGWKIW